MAKALFGHAMSPPDTQLLYEARRLRAQVAELEAEVVRLRAENDRLLSEVSRGPELLDELVEVADEALTRL